jgi:hypothetical protein
VRIEVIYEDCSLPSWYFLPPSDDLISGKRSEGASPQSKNPMQGESLKELVNSEASDNLFFTN